MKKNRKMGNEKGGRGGRSTRTGTDVANRSNEEGGGDHGKGRHHPRGAKKGCGMAWRQASEACEGVKVVLFVLITLSVYIAGTVEGQHAPHAEGAS